MELKFLRSLEPTGDDDSKWRFKGAEPHDIWGDLLGELWELIFDLGSPDDYYNLQLVSKWTYNLFWDYRTEYNFCGSEQSEDQINAVLQKCNPRRTTSIWLDKCRVGKKILSFLSFLPLPYLTRLSLVDTKISDDDMLAIGSLVNLRYLNCGSIAMTDRGVGYLTKLTRLETLLLKECRILT